MANQVVVLGGGNSPERKISLLSANSIIEAAKKAGFDALFIDTRHGYDQLDTISKNTPVLPILHGVGGEDGEVQFELESRHLKFLGTGSKASGIAFDKWLTRLELIKNDIQTPRGKLVGIDEYPNCELTKSPHVLKACRNGSSIGTYIVNDPSKTNNELIDEVFKYGEKALVEELITGIEITVPILGNRTLPIIEIIPPKGKVFDYQNKYNGKTQELCPPVHISTEQISKANEISLKTHNALGCLHISRTDIMIAPSGKMYVLEINTMPGMTAQSLFPKSAAIAGIDFPELVNKFVDLAMQEKRYN